MGQRLTTTLDADSLRPPPERDLEALPQLTLLVGPIDSGKTTFLRNWYNTWGWGDGFLSAKRFDGATFAGYDLERLSSGESCVWARVKGREIPGAKPWIAVGPFHMYRDGLGLASDVVEAVIKARSGPMILDEIGPLELEGRAFAPLLELLLVSRLPTIIAIRDFCVQPFLASFTVDKTCIVNLEAGPRKA